MKNIEKINELYAKLTENEKNIVAIYKHDLKVLTWIYENASNEQIDTKEIQYFCKKNMVSKKVYNYLLAYYLNEYATPNQVDKLITAVKYRKKIGANTYKRIIQNIINEVDEEEQKRLLHEYKTIYSFHATKFAEETGQYDEIKHLNILYREMLKSVPPKNKNIISHKATEKYFVLLDEAMINIDKKLSSYNYYIDDEMQTVRDTLNYLASHVKPERLQSYRTHMKKYYNIVAAEVLKSAEMNPEQFGVVDYYSITNINPLRLFRTTNQKHSPLVLKIICKLSSYKERNYGATPMMIDETYFNQIGKYSYLGMTVTMEEMMMVYHQMNPEIPKNEYIYMEFLKDYIKKKKDKTICLKKHKK